MWYSAVVAHLPQGSRACAFLISFSAHHGYKAWLVPGVHVLLLKWPVSVMLLTKMPY